MIQRKFIFINRIREPSSEKEGVFDLRKLKEKLSVNVFLEKKEYVIAVILVASLGKLYLYYDAFNIYIFSFISLSESVVLFGGILLNFLVIMFFYIQALLFVSKKQYAYYILLVAFAIFLQCPGIGFDDDFKRIELALGILISIGGAILFYFLYRGEEKTLEQKMQNVPIKLIYILIFFLLGEAGVEIVGVKCFNRYGKVQIEMENSDLVQCNQTLRFVGTTRDHTFVYNTEADATTVYNNEDIKSVTFPSKK
jgi:hypothetical protein